MLYYHIYIAGVPRLKEQSMRLCAALCLIALPAAAEVPTVVTDIVPVQSLVAQVMGDLGQPVLLLEHGADEHDFQLRPSQMQAIADADLIVWIGPQLTPWLDRARASSRAAQLGLLEAPGTQVQPYVDASGHADHDHSGIDPHVWLNPDNAARWLPLIADQLSAADPANAGAYAANAAAAATQMTALDRDIAAALAPAANEPFVTYHNAYGYFAAHYGLTFAGSLADGEAADPGAAHLTELQERLRAQNVRCVFPEAQHDPALAAQLLDGTSSRLGGALDPVGSTLDPGPQAYGALMRGLADVMMACLRG